jgi:nucleotide-binding universal stress UspA family protein
VVETIILCAQRESADLIALASHGRGGLAGVFYGSVAAGLLHRVDRPLLIIRSPGGE